MTQSCVVSGVSLEYGTSGEEWESHLVLQITGFPYRYMYLLFDLVLGRAQFIDYIFWRIRVGLLLL